jgi:hypothetical protein
LSARGLAVLAATAAAGCDYIAPPDPLELDPDVVSIAIVLAAGQSEAFLLAGHPHRPALDPPPDVSATLLGPGWEAPFSDTMDLEHHCGGGPTDWPMPMVCLRAPLPEPIRERTAYKLEGTTTKGPFTGSTVVPSAPEILSPADTFRLAATRDSENWRRIPIRYRTPDDVGTLRGEMLAVLSDSTGTETEWIGVWPYDLDVSASADTLYIDRDERLQRGWLHLLGIGWQYTNFLEASDRHDRQPSFGIEGEGVYGYFDGSARSRPLNVIVGDP